LGVYFYEENESSIQHFNTILNSKMGNTKNPKIDRLRFL